MQQPAMDASRPAAGTHPAIEQTDVVLIGAGPIGIEMAVALKREGVPYVHVDAGQVGATIQWFAPGTRFFSSPERIAIAGVPLQTLDQGKATREEYLRYLRTIVQGFGLAVRTFEPVVGIDRQADGTFLVTTDPLPGRRQVRAQRVILATGGTAHPRKLGVPGEDLPHVEKYFQEPHVYFGRRVLIIGGKNSAVEAALRIQHVGAKVAISYRRPQLDPKSIKYWLLPEINGLIQAGVIEGHFQTMPTAITPEHVVLARVDEAMNPIAGSERHVPVDVVLSLIGYEADMSLCRMAGVDVRGPCLTPVHDHRTMETSMPGVYVAGTVVGGTQDKYRLFIENCHVHVERIVAALKGQVKEVAEPVFERPES
jgi:thioredoxin reductase (NADPH)